MKKPVLIAIIIGAISVVAAVIAVITICSRKFKKR